MAQRCNFGMACLPSAARTATTTWVAPENKRHAGVLVILNVTAASGTGGLTLHIQDLDPISGNAIDVLVDTAAITANGTYAFELNPAEGTAGNGVRIASSRRLSRDWQIKIAVGDSSSYTYSVSATLFTP